MSDSKWLFYGMKLNGENLSILSATHESLSKLLFSSLFESEVIRNDEVSLFSRNDGPNGSASVSH